MKNDESWKGWGVGGGKEGGIRRKTEMMQRYSFIFVLADLQRKKKDRLKSYKGAKILKVNFAYF